MHLHTITQLITSISVLPCRSLIVVFWAGTFSHQRLLFCYTAIQITSIPAANFQGWIWTWLDCCFTEWSNMITPRSVSWSVLTVSTWSIIVLNIVGNNYLILAEFLSLLIYNETLSQLNFWYGIGLMVTEGMSVKKMHKRQSKSPKVVCILFIRKILTPSNTARNLSVTVWLVSMWHTAVYSQPITNAPCV